jgi:hypothetical protein
MTQSVWNEGPKAFTAGEDLLVNRRVKVESGTTTTPPEIVYADAGESFIGTTLVDAEDGDRNVTVLVRTQLVVAAEAFAINAVLYGAADGKVADTESGEQQFLALEAATADGDVIEAVMMIERGSIDDTALTTATPAILPGSINTIDSTDNAVDATLADDTVIGRQTKIVMTEASNSSTVTIASHETNDAEVATFDAVDEYLILEWSGTEYVTRFATATFV